MSKRVTYQILALNDYLLEKGFKSLKEAKKIAAKLYSINGYKIVKVEEIKIVVVVQFKENKNDQ